jgi:cysteine desulfurase
LEQAKRQVAAATGAEPNQVVFTSGGTEADNLAIIGQRWRHGERQEPMLVAVTATEHKAVLAAAHAVKHLGGEERFSRWTATAWWTWTRWTGSSRGGRRRFRSCGVNNETGAVQPVEAIAARCEATGVCFHTDAVQAFGKIPFSVLDLPCTLVTISGHKIGAPKGIGALIVRDRKAIEAILHGGGQQFGIRPGTENVAGAVALGRAAELAVAELDTQAKRLGELRDQLTRRLKASVSDIVVNSEDTRRASHILSIAVPGTDSEALLMHFDLAGIAVSGGSACTTGAMEPSHVLTAMGDAAGAGAGRDALQPGIRRDDAGRYRPCGGGLFPAVVAKVRKLPASLGR